MLAEKLVVDALFYSERQKPDPPRSFAFDRTVLSTLLSIYSVLVRPAYAWLAGEWAAAHPFTQLCTPFSISCPREVGFPDKVG